MARHHFVLVTVASDDEVPLERDLLSPTLFHVLAYWSRAGQLSE